MIIVNKFNTSQMKKYIIGSLAIATIAIAGWNFNQKSEVQLTDLALDNVEALASGEQNSPKMCYQTIVSGLNYLIRDCSHCGYTSASFYGGTYFCNSTW